MPSVPDASAGSYSLLSPPCTLIYAYHRESGEIVAYVWGNRDLKTAKKMRKRIKRLGISYDMVATDDWDSFLSAFGEDNDEVGKDILFQSNHNGSFRFYPVFGRFEYF
jgi:IS1 family transposase